MDKTTAQRLVRDTFKATFDPKRFRDFIKELCNGFNDSKAIPSMEVPHPFAEHVKSCQRLGTFESPEGELADVLVVRLTASSKLERTRTALRDFVAHKLKRHQAGDPPAYKEAGLVAFVAPDSQSWRFSYVRMEYETKRDPKTRKIRPEERLTPARRYSYLVGADEECHTAQSRFLTLLQNTVDKPTLAQIEEAFSVEAVTKEFFREYVRLFNDTETALAGVVKRNKAVRDDFAAKGVTAVDFAKKLLGQIVFLYFVQKKGWLGVDKGRQWGEGSRAFLRQLADRAIREQRCLFYDVLERLFYDTLATDRGHEAWCKNLGCRIPFLNGGLFEPLAGYDWAKTKIALPNTLFTNRTRSEAGDVGTGILDVFDRYNFTVNEAEPLEQEVAIDPEMLGKVFENLIEDNRRKGLGAFYTPREIVHFMCQESLISYLDTRLNHPAAPIGTDAPKPEPEMPLFVDSAEKPKTKPAQEEFAEVREHALVLRKDLEVWIRQSDQFAHYAAATKGDHYPKPPDSIRRFAHEIDVLLRDITVCDPAIGSGAFPVGMMTEIVRARLALTPWFNDVVERTAYLFKRHIIQSCIHGVDIDPGAVEIAKLRLWLSLVVDEEDVQRIKPLPNLDYKIVVGNSLLGFPFKSQRVHKIEKLKADYFDETDHGKKGKLKREIDAELEEAFAASKRSLGYEVTFDFQIYFSEIFRTNKGFDVVIGNPPYVLINKKSFESDFGRSYPLLAGKPDLYRMFIERCLRLGSTEGCLCFIIPNTLLAIPSAQRLRAHITREHDIHLLLDLATPVFGEAAVNSIIMMIGFGARTTKDSLFGAAESTDALGARLSSISQSSWLQNARCEWTIHVDDESTALVQKLNKWRLNVGVVLEDITLGMQVYHNTIHSASQMERRYLHSEERESPDWIPEHGGRSVERFRFRTDRVVPFVDYSAAAIYQKPEPRFFRGARIILREIIGDTLTAAYATNDFAVNKACYVLRSNRLSARQLKTFVAILSSRCVGFWVQRCGDKAKQALFPRVTMHTLRAIPVPDHWETRNETLSLLVDQILAAKQRDAGADVSALEREIDELVYALYGLTSEEIQIVEGVKK